MLRKISEMKILVTGARGQLGLKIKDAAMDMSMFKFDYFDLDELNIGDYDAVDNYLKHGGYFALINCAAYTAVDKAESEHDACFKINSEAPANMALICKKYNTHFIHFSTDYVFDGTAQEPYKEDHQVKPLSVYGKSKASGEKKIMELNPESLIIRTSWLYSEYGSNFVKTMLRIAAERDEIKVVNDQFGSPTYAGDLAKTVLQILVQSVDTGKTFSGIYHYSNTGSCTWYEFAKEILVQSNISTSVIPVTSKEFPVVAIRPKYSIFDKSKIIGDFNLSIPKWEDSLKKMLEKYFSE